MIIERGSALWMPTPRPRNNSLKHLFVALTDPVSVAGYPSPGVLLVNLSSIYEGRDVDGACILQPGDHARITRPSYAVYRLARIDRVDALVEDIESGHIEVLEPVVPYVIDRICAGLEASPNTPEEIMAFYREAERLRLNT